MFRSRLLIAIAMLLAVAVVPASAQTPPTAGAMAQPEGETPDDGAKASGTQNNIEGPANDGVSSAPSAATETARPAPEAEPGAPEAAAEVAEPARKFTVSTWGGAYGQAQKNVVVTPFGNSHDVEIEVVARSNGNDLSGDVVELDAAAIDAACQSGAVVPIDAASLAAPAETGTAAQDFIADGLHDCGPASFVWSAVIAVNEKALESGNPDSLQDVFDTKRFPGQRAFIESPRHLLEMALVADGVAPAEVYEQLASDEGLERALAKLDSLGKDLVWHDGAKQTEGKLVSGSAVFVQTFNGQAFYAAAYGAPIRIIWDGQVYSMSFWAVPAEGSSQTLAKEFVAFATAPQRLAAVAEEIAYGPARISAVALAKEHAQVGLDLTPYLPTRPENLARAVAFNPAWWDENGARIDARFAAWVEEREAAMRPKPMPKPERKSD